MEIGTLRIVPTPAPSQELDRLGDEIAELSAHLDAAIARLLDLIREFDARGGWNTGFPSCAAWLTEGYQLDRQPDGALRFRRPDGRLLPEVPPPPEVPIDPARTLIARNAAEGLHLHAGTAMPGWQGERLDVGWAIDVLHPLAR